MPTQQFLVTFQNNTASQQSNLKPWLIADNAFENLFDAYVWRGRVKKRFGSQYMVEGNALSSQLRINLGNTSDPAGNLAGNVPGNHYGIGQMFTCGNEIYTVNALGAPANMLINGSATTATYNTATGAYNIAGAPPATAVYFYPADPVMGIFQYEKNGPINENPSYAFDTQFSYTFAGTAWEGVDTAATVFTGGDDNFFWLWNYVGSSLDEPAMYVTNYYYNSSTYAPGDEMKYTVNGTAWNKFEPVYAYDGAPAIKTGIVSTCRLIVNFKGRLILLNTIESDPGAARVYKKYGSRARFSAFGSPLPADGTTVSSAWLQQGQNWTGTTSIGANAIDALTQEEIISCSFIRDRLIVFFENSTWELVYTGNQLAPFLWQQINSELGAESTFSRIEFDRTTLTVGNVGIHACNGTNVARIDEKIPGFVFEIGNLDTNPVRVGGIRDFYNELACWTINQTNINNLSTQYFPNRMLIYNYITDSWAIFQDTVTTFGYWDEATAPTWASMDITWEEADMTWNSGVLNSGNKLVLAGNQEGFIYIIRPERSLKSHDLYVTDVATVAGATRFTVVNHMMQEGDYIVTTLDAAVPEFDFVVHTVTNVIDTNNFEVDTPLTSTYTGGMYMLRLPATRIKTAQWNPFTKIGNTVYLSKVDFLVDRTDNGQIFVNYYPSSGNLGTVEQGAATGALLGNSILETSPYELEDYENQQARLWHTLYFQAEGNVIQLEIYWTEDQYKVPLNEENDYAWMDDLQIHAFLLYVTNASTRLS